jgi:surface protein
MKKLLLLSALSLYTFTFSQTPITDANFHSAVNTCLSTNPIDGMCSNSQYGAMPDWDVSNVTDMSYAFNPNCSTNPASFNGNISNWDVSNVTNMRGMLGCLLDFNQDLSSWDVSNVTDMAYMFYTALSFNQPLDTWDVSNVTDMASMFYNAQSFNQPLDNWDVSNVTNMAGMFRDAKSFNQPLDTWDVSNVTNMLDIFNYAQSFNQPLDTWDVSNVTNMTRMFNYAQSFNQPLDTWDVSNVTKMGGMFAGSAFNQPLDTWDVSNVTKMAKMFSTAQSFNQPLDTWDVSNVTDMSWMFRGAHSFNQPLDTWDVSNVTNMLGMYSSAISFNQPINNWDVSNVTDMSWMFSQTPFNQPINNWDVSNVTDMAYMFYNAQSFNQPLDSWDVSNVTNMFGMFLNAEVFDQDISSWNITSVTERIFCCGGSTFYSDSSMERMFEGSNLSIDNYDAILVSWSQQDVQQNVTFGAQGINYCSDGRVARQSLIDNKNWDITDNGIADDCINCLKLNDADIYIDINNDIEIYLNALQEIRGFQFDVTFPEGFSFNPSNITLLDIPESFNVSASNIGDNVYRVIGFSFTNEAIPIGNMPIISLPLVIDNTVPTGDYVVPITGLILQDVNNESVEDDLCVGDGLLSLFDNPLGDSTGDNIVNIVDILATIDYIFGNPPATFLFDLADVNFDNTINILDVLGIQDIILAPDTFSEQETDESRTALTGINYLAIEDNLIEPNSSDVVAIKLNNEDVIKGLQFDFALPEGITLNASDIVATSRLNGFILSAQEISANTFRVLVFSLSSAIIDIGTEAIINLPVFVEPDISNGVYPIEFTDVTISDVNNIDVSTTAPSLGEVTVAPLSVFDMEKSYKIYPNPTSGIINLYGNDKELQVVVFDVLGKEILKINAIDNIDINGFENGIYFLKLIDGINISTHKIIKRTK